MQYLKANLWEINLCDNKPYLHSLQQDLLPLQFVRWRLAPGLHIHTGCPPEVSHVDIAWLQLCSPCLHVQNSPSNPDLHTQVPDDWSHDWVFLGSQLHVFSQLFPKRRDGQAKSYRIKLIKLRFIKHTDDCNRATTQLKFWLNFHQLKLKY